MWQIEHECPQCGAPITLEETERLFACPYCKVRLYIACEGVPRYYLPPLHFEKQIAYVPYWRTKGIDFTCSATGVTTGRIDRTSLAYRSSCFPYSLGVRPQVFKLRFVGPTLEKTLLQPCIELKDAHDAPAVPVVPFDRSPIPDPILFRAAMCEVESLIFSPVGFQGDRLCDAVDGKVLEEKIREPIPQPSSPGGARHEVSFIPTLCPNCGADLIGEKESILLFCSNCRQGWKVAGNALTNASVIFFPGAKDATYLPFWSVQLDLEGMEERLFINPAKTGGPAARRLFLDDPGFSLWLPAFKVSAEIFLRLTERATVAQPTLDDAEGEIKDNLYPVTLPETEAARVAKVLVAFLLARPETARSLYNRPGVTSREAQLCFIPFSFTGYELVQEKMRMSILPNALKYGKNL